MFVVELELQNTDSHMSGSTDGENDLHGLEMSAPGAVDLPAKADSQRGGRPIFVLGDSRTGTLSLSNYFRMNGLKSVHYFVSESRQTTPIHMNFSTNERYFFDYVQNSGMDAYTDYPTRAFFRRLYQDYPKAAFILSVRSSTDVWLASMQRFFDKFDQAIDITEARQAYEEVNTDIRTLFGDGTRYFLEICIDNDSTQNSKLLADFLGFSGDVMLSHDNSSDMIDNCILSKRFRFYSSAGEHALQAIERSVAPGKAIISEYGWAFLVNDSNYFMQVQFGQLRWTDADRTTAANVINTRVDVLRDKGVLYRKFIIPEKSVIYREYMPRVLEGLPVAALRPAEMMSEDLPKVAYYLGSFLADARSYGQIYFRGDSHTNWLGSWFVYTYIFQRLAAEALIDSKEIFQISDLTPSVAAYDGDLWTQLNADLKAEFQSRWAFTTARHGLEITTKLEIPDDKRRAYLVPTPEEYNVWFTGRETFVYERPDAIGKKIVVFRDSTLDFCHDLIAQHFSRAVFVWHQGQVFNEVVERERPDLVLHVMAERFVTRYPMFQPFGSIGQNEINQHYGPR